MFRLKVVVTIYLYVVVIIIRLEAQNNIYNGEFDPGSGWTLAAGLIHASQGGSNTTGGRVRNAYVTCLLHWDNFLKQRLILDGIIWWHH